MDQSQKTYPLKYIVARMREVEQGTLRTLGAYFTGPDLQCPDESHDNTKTAPCYLTGSFKALKTKFLDLYGEPLPTTDLDDWLRVWHRFHRSKIMVTRRCCECLNKEK